MTYHKVLHKDMFITFFQQQLSLSKKCVHSAGCHHKMALVEAGSSEKPPPFKTQSLEIELILKWVCLLARLLPPSLTHYYKIVTQLGKTTHVLFFSLHQYGYWLKIRALKRWIKFVKIVENGNTNFLPLFCSVSCNLLFLFTYVHFQKSSIFTFLF